MDTVGKFLSLGADAALTDVTEIASDREGNTALELAKDTATFECLRAAGAKMPDITVYNRARFASICTIWTRAPSVRCAAGWRQCGSYQYVQGDPAALWAIAHRCHNQSSCGSSQPSASMYAIHLQYRLYFIKPLLLCVEHNTKARPKFRVSYTVKPPLLHKVLYKVLKRQYPAHVMRCFIPLLNVANVANVR